LEIYLDSDFVFGMLLLIIRYGTNHSGNKTGVQCLNYVLFGI